MSDRRTAVLEMIKKRSFVMVLGIMLALMFAPACPFFGIDFGADTAFARTSVHLTNGQSYDISTAGKNTVVYIDDNTASGSGGVGTVELKGKSTYVWVNISVSKGKTVYVKLADGLTIKPGKNSSYGTGPWYNTLGKSRSGIYVDETKKSGGVVHLTSEKNAKIIVDSHKEFAYENVPAIMKNNTKTKLIFDTEDPSSPGTIIAKPTSSKNTADTCAIGAFGHGFLGIAYSSHTAGNIEFKSGNIEAYGERGGGGIGSCEYSHVGDLVFSGAHVKACAGNTSVHTAMTGAAGIGASYRGNVGTISITGGYVEAWGLGSLKKDEKGFSQIRILDTAGCGIGGGWYKSHVNEIKITGGTVKAHGGTCGEGESRSISGCGIGTTVHVGGKAPYSSVDKITITGGDITAVGGCYTAGIGGSVKDIVIAPATKDTELKINASIDDRRDRVGKRLALGSGIGSACNAEEFAYTDYPGNITIKGGDITAIAGNAGDFNSKIMYAGSGIGPTSQGKVSCISISGGKINAVGGWNCPGIGGPNHCADPEYQTVDQIHISGGTITATKATHNGKGTALSGIGGYKKGDTVRTDIRITGGNVISNGDAYAIGYDEAGQPRNDAGEIVYGTKFKFNPDLGEWAGINHFRLDPALEYDYGLNDVFTKKGLDNESDVNLAEFWIPKNKDEKKYTCYSYAADRAYKTIDPEKIEPGDTTTLAAYTDIRYVNQLTGNKYHGIGVYSADKLSINPAPAVIPRYQLAGYADKSGKMVVNGTYGQTELTPLVQGTDYVDKRGKWLAKDAQLELYLMLNQTDYVVKYDQNQPAKASHKVTGTMEDSTFPVRGASQLPANQYSLAGWEFTGWNTKPDGTGIPYADEGNIEFGKWDTLTLYAQWEPKKYTVTFQSGDAGIAPDYLQKGLEYDSTYHLDSIQKIGWAYSGHSFHGWRGAGFGSFYEDVEEFHNLCALDSNGDPQGRTLYADWIGTGTIKVTTTVDGVPADIGNDMNISLIDPGASSVIPLTGVASDPGHYSAQLAGLIPGNYQLSMDGQDGKYKIPQDKQLLNNLTEASAVSVILDYYTVTMHGEDHADSAYVKEEGTGNPQTSMEVPDDTSVVIGASAEPGYHFDGYSYYGVEPGWEHALTIADQKITVTGKVDITAHGEANVYHVKYDPNKPANASHEVKGSMQKQDFVFDEPQVLWENDYSLTGWTFTGWNTKKDGSGEALNDQTSMDDIVWQKLGYPEHDAEIALYAQWEPNRYKVYFSASDAMSGQMDPQGFTYDDAPTALTANAFKRTDWQFTGWNTEPTGGGKSYKDGEAVRNLTTGKSITLYAQWEHDYYTVQFDKNDERATGEMRDAKVWTNCAYEIPPCGFCKTGYHFESWNTKADGNGTRYAAGDVLENAVPKGESMTLYAQWVPNEYVVTFDANKGSGKMANQSFRFDETQNLNVNRFKKAHYTFTGWNTEANGSGTGYRDKARVQNLTFMQNGTVTLYAQWEKTKHDITYDLNGGTLNGKTGKIVITCREMDVITIMDAPKKKGYKFKYWEGSKYYPGDKYTVKDDHTLTAVWEKKKHGGGTSTGDGTNLTLLILLLLASGTGVLTILLIRRACR